MQLNYKIFGEGEPVIILHGLYGMLDNWVSIARALQGEFKIILIDLRNHGKSEHSIEHNYQVMVDDLADFMNEQQLFAVNILGHSMGGKVAMAFAAYNPERVKRLIVVDISPRTYSIEMGDVQLTEHKLIMEALMDLNLSKVIKREDADLLLSEQISSNKIRTFLLKNLSRTHNHGFEWKMNLPVLYKNINRIIEGFEPIYSDFKHLHQPVLFIKGGDSDYIKEADEKLLRELFLNITLKKIEGASHWVHAEKPHEFLSVVSSFLSNDNSKL